MKMLLCVDICTCFPTSVWPVPLILLLAVLNIFAQILSKKYLNPASIDPKMAAACCCSNIFASTL